MIYVDTDFTVISKFALTPFFQIISFMKFDLTLP